MLRMSPKFKSALLFLDQGVFSGSSFLITILLARLLFVEDFGVYAGVVLVLYLLVSLINAFVSQPMQVRLSHENDKHTYLSFTFWFQLASSIVVVAIVFLLFMAPIDLLAQYSTLTLPIALFSLGFILHDYFRKRFLAEDRIPETLLIDALLMAGQFFAIGYSFYISTSSLSQIILLLGFGYVPAFLTGAFLSNPSFKNAQQWLGFLKVHINEGKWLFYSALIQWWAGNLFVVASGFFLGPVALGALRLVQSVFGLLNVLFQTFENYVLPQTAIRLHQSSDDARAFLRKVGAKSLLGVSTLLLILFLFSDFFIVMAGGEQFREYGFLIKGMSILYALIFVGYPIRIAIRVLVLNKIFFKGYVLTFVFGLLSSYLLLSLFHLAGAIAGLITSQLILIIYWQYQLQKKEFILWK